MSNASFVRKAAVFEEISALTAEDVGRRIRVMGFVVNVQNELVTLSDDTGSIVVVVENPPELQAFIRVFGSVVLSSNGQLMIHADLVQDIERLDKQLYKRAMRLFKTLLPGRTD